MSEKRHNRRVVDTLSEPSIDSGEVPEHSIVVAIDFGTSYSGYAFQIKSNADDRLKGHGKVAETIVNTNWGAGTAYENNKTQTCILLDENGKLIEFGENAVEEYIERQEEDPENASKLYFFDKFKMTLHNRLQRRPEDKITKNYTLTAANGKDFSAIKVFARAIEFLRDNFKENVKKHTGVPVQNTDLLWVLTVPAIWDDWAKGFMRNAAYEADLVKRNDAGRLVIAREPEAAALLCRTLSIPPIGNRKQLSLPGVGTKYLIVDVGGGTVDITAHEILKDNKVREIMRPQGGALGGMQVDKAFDKLLDDKFSKDFMRTYRKEHPSFYKKMMQDFEKGKLKCTYGENCKLNIPIHHHFYTTYLELAGAPQGGATHSYKEVKEDDGISLHRGGAMVLNYRAVKKLCEPVINDIVKTLKTLLDDPVLSGLATIYMVGGFSECPLLRQSVEVAVAPRVISPMDARHAVLKGAVMFGCDPAVVSERVMSRTYGTNYALVFEEGDSESRKQRINGKNYCINKFHTFVKKGQTVCNGHVEEEQFVPIEENPTRFVASIYTSTKDSVEYSDEPECQEVAEVTVIFPEKVLEREGLKTCRLSLTFGATEIRVKAVEEASNVEGTVDVKYV